MTAPPAGPAPVPDTGSYEVSASEDVWQSGSTDAATTLPKSSSSSPRLVTDSRVHSRCALHSAINGDRTWRAGSKVSPDRRMRSAP
jgi:hypothetical protein